MNVYLKSTPASVVEIIRQCAEKYNVPLYDVVGQTRVRMACLARFEAMSRVHKEVVVNRTSPSLPQIGRWFGNRDHTTVLNALRRHSELLGERPPTAKYTISIAPHRLQLMEDLADSTQHSFAA